MKVNYTFEVGYYSKETRKRVRTPTGFPRQIEVVDVEMHHLTKFDVMRAFNAELLSRGLELSEKIFPYVEPVQLDPGDSSAVN